MIELHESIQALVKETKPVWTFLVCILFSIFHNVTAEKFRKHTVVLGGGLGGALS